MIELCKILDCQKIRDPDIKKCLDNIIGQWGIGNESYFKWYVDDDISGREDDDPYVLFNTYLKEECGLGSGETVIILYWW